MPYFHTINTLFIHIPKTGGTSVEIYFSNKLNISLSTNTLYSSFNHYNNHSLQHCTYKELYNNRYKFKINFDNIKIISIVRNPYHRIISDLFFFQLINTSMTNEEIYDKIIFFINSDVKKFDNHKLPQYLYLFNNDNIIDSSIIIMKTETLNEDMSKNGYDDFQYKKKKNVTHRNKIDYMKLLNNKSIKLINDYYEKDFEYFNYEKKINLITICYGIKNNNVDVTHTALTNCIKNNILRIPNNDHTRFSIFKIDPTPNVVKSVFIYDKEHKLIGEYDHTENIEINLKTNEFFCE